MQPELVIVGHSDVVTALAFSADGKTLVSDGADQIAIVWDVASGRMRRRLRLEWGGGLVLTPDGNTLVVDDGRVWNVPAWRQIRRSRRCLPPFACSPDGKLLASSAFNTEGEGWVILVSDLKTGRKRQRFPCSCFQPSALAFSSDGKLVGVSGSEQQNEDTYVAVTTLCDLETGRLRQPLRNCDLSSLVGVAMMPQTRLVGLTADGRQVLDVETGQTLHTIEVGELPRSVGSILERTLSPCGRLVAWGTDNGYLLVIEVSTSRQLWQTQAHTGFLRAPTFTADSRMLATAGDDHIIRLWDASTGAPIRAFGKQGVAVEAVAFSPDGQAITALSKDGTVRLWGLNTLRCERQETECPLVVRHLAPMNPDTARNVWNITSSLLPADQAYGANLEYRFPCQIAAVSPDGSLVALHGVEAGAHCLQIWNPSTQTVQSTLPNGSYPWGVATFSPDNHLLALTNDVAHLHLYDTRSGSMVRELVVTMENVEATIELQFSPDGRTLASGDGAFAILLWDVETGQIKRRLDAHGECVASLAFSPDGRTLAVAAAYSKSGWLKSLGRGKQRFLRGHTGTLRSITFSPGGTLLATGAEDGTVRLWKADSGQLIATFLALPGEEWLTYMPDGSYTGSPGAQQYLLWQSGDDLLPADELPDR